MKYIKEILESIHNAIQGEEGEKIKVYNESKEHWFELFVTLPDDQGTMTVERGKTFDEVFNEIPRYIEEYRFDRIHIDVWTSPQKQMSDLLLITPERAYEAIKKYFVENNIEHLQVGNVNKRFWIFPEYQLHDANSGRYYQDSIAYEYFHDLVCHIPDRQPKDYKESGSTYHDLVTYCDKYKLKNIDFLFHRLGWEHPRSVLHRWKNSR